MLGFLVFTIIEFTVVNYSMVAYMKMRKKITDNFVKIRQIEKSEKNIGLKVLHEAREQTKHYLADTEDLQKQINEAHQEEITKKEEEKDAVHLFTGGSAVPAAGAPAAAADVKVNAFTKVEDNPG